MNKKNLVLLLIAVIAVVLSGIMRSKPPEQPEEWDEESLYSRDGTLIYEVPGTNAVLRYWIVEDGIKIGSCNRDVEGELRIPEKINGENVKYISDWVFHGCQNLTSVKLPPSIAKIGYNAFAGCNALTEIELPDGILDIGEGAFWECNSLQSINLPAKLISIGQNAFYSCDSLENISIEPENELYCTMDGVLFDKSCELLICYPAGKRKEIYDIPQGVKKIGNYAFANCKNLEVIGLACGITELGDCAFWGCSGLKSIELPNEMTEIGSYIFRECGSLESIFVESGNMKYRSIDGVLFDKLGIKLLKYPEGKKESFYKVPEEVRKIADDAFSYCSNLTYVELPMKLTEIGSASFACCSNLTEIDFPMNLTDIGEGAFSCCSSLTSIKLPKYAKNIGASAFSECTALKTVIMPETLTFINLHMFNLCSSLEEITLPKELTSIYSSAFCGCDALKNIHYCGSEEEWKNIVIDSVQNEALFKATIHYNSILPSEYELPDIPYADHVTGSG